MASQTSGMDIEGLLDVLHSRILLGNGTFNLYVDSSTLALSRNHEKSLSQ
jgi:hypothetical protein